MDVPVPSETPDTCAHATASIEAAEPTVNGKTSGDREVATSSAEIPAKEPGVITNGIDASIKESEIFTQPNGVHEVVSEVETKAKPIRDSGIGFVNSEDSTNRF